MDIWGVSQGDGSGIWCLKSVMCLSGRSPERELQVLVVTVWVRPPLLTHNFSVKSLFLLAIATAVSWQNYGCLLLSSFLGSGGQTWECCVRGECNMQKLRDCRWEMLHRLDNKYDLNLLIDTLLTSLAYSFMKPAVFQTMERDFLRNVSTGSRELFTWGRKTREQACTLHGSVRFIGGTAFMACRGNYQ